MISSYKILPLCQGLPGRRGLKGDTGEEGKTGPSGRDGKDGVPGSPGLRGPVRPALLTYYRSSIQYYYVMVSPNTKGRLIIQSRELGEITH